VVYHCHTVTDALILIGFFAGPNSYTRLIRPPSAKLLVGRFLPLANYKSKTPVSISLGVSVDTEKCPDNEQASGKVPSLGKTVSLMISCQLSEDPLPTDCVLAKS
jgi:hypothetical protein